jgi:23S rRNA (adenine2030-N6)-methyltransferase
MNYRHAFHAGNHADVLKHVVLLELLAALARKPAPYFVLDTHAGSGRYALAADGEAASGILRLAAQETPTLARYRDAVAAHNTDSRMSNYPGSPLLIAGALRDDDRLACCELQPEEAATLKTLLHHDPRVGVHRRDGYDALGALLPPPEKRGLVLIDPPYEAQDAEYPRILDALKQGLTRWPQGIFALWYPIKRRRTLLPFFRRVAALPAKSALLVELLVQPDDSPLRLNGSGMLILNPPWQLDRALPPLLGALHTALAPDTGSTRLEWLKPEAA